MVSKTDSLKRCFSCFTFSARKRTRHSSHTATRVRFFRAKTEHLKQYFKDLHLTKGLSQGRDCLICVKFAQKLALTVLYVPNLVGSGPGTRPTRRRASALSERKWNSSKGFKDLNLKNGSSQGQNLALTILHVRGLPRSKETARP